MIHFLSAPSAVALRYMVLMMPSRHSMVLGSNSPRVRWREGWEMGEGSGGERGERSEDKVEQRERGDGARWGRG